jgi:hypothetical protein
MALSVIYLGIRGSVVCMDRTAGKMLWITELKGSDFVNLLVDDDRIIATTKGEVFCLDAANGTLLWNDRLRGLGTGLVTIATATGASNPVPPAEKRRRDQAAAATAATAAASG